MKTNRLSLIILGLIIIVSFVVMIITARVNSETTDEAIHLLAGYTYLEKRDFRLDSEHPPLLKELAALPLVFQQKVNFEYDENWQRAGDYYYDSWQEARFLSNRFFYELGNDANNMLFSGRMVFIILTIFLGLLVYVWTKELYGPKAGVFGAFLTLFFPNILAHGILINTDLGITLFILLGVYLWNKFLKIATWKNALLAGLGLGLVLATKFTGVILVPIIIVLTIVKYFFFNQKSEIKIKNIIGGLALMAIVSFIVVWLTYGFSLKLPPPIESLYTNSQNYLPEIKIKRLAEVTRYLLFPADFYKGLFLVLKHVDTGHSSFLLGQSSGQGWWYYFPVAMLVKTPVAFLIMLVLAFYQTFIWKKSWKQYEEIVLLLVPVLFLGFAMYSKANLGVRHILPIFPFLIIFTAKVIIPVRLERLAKVLSNFKVAFYSWLIIILSVWFLVSSFLSFTNYLAYFNEIVLGPQNGYRVLNDSNLDWGQDIYRIKKFLKKENSKEPTYIVYPWNGDLALNYYGINLPQFEPTSSERNVRVIISATYLEIEAYQWLKSYPHIQITPGVFLFYLREN